jgi:Ohr subfamily peroxiredoxin
MVDVKYRTKGSASGGGREGHARSADGKVDVQLSVPKELGGGGGPGTNPEQLFAAGYSACFLGAMRHVAGQEKIKMPDDATVEAEVGIGPREDGTGFGLEVALTAHLPGMDKAAAEALVAKADIVCPYSHATRGNIKRTLSVA